jgi:predicted CXXCH cytochrome family protein
VELVDHRIPLGRRGELECTACHDPHNNELGNFLLITDREGALCTTCHEMFGWRFSAHALSARSVPPVVTAGEQLPYRSMADNACAACHPSHSAPRRQQLLWDQPSLLCIRCHDGVSARTVLPVLNQRSGHRVNTLVDRPAGRAGRRHLGRRVACSDCHNPHAVQNRLFQGRAARVGDGPLVPPSLRYMPGVNIVGMEVFPATFYYEVCFQCHADWPVRDRNRIIRQVDTGGNIRRQFLPTAASAHPVAFPSRNATEVPSLLPAYRSRQFISCQDCHNNADAVDAGGVLVNGPHGSRYDYILVRRYETRDFTVESPQSYALCYECHDRNSILSNESFSLHERHVVRGRSPCSACHTAHGVVGSPTQHSHLINFDLTIVGGERVYIDTGRFRGTCTLTCHGVRHVNFTYSR